MMCFDSFIKAQNCMKLIVTKNEILLKYINFKNI